MAVGLDEARAVIAELGKAVERLRAEANVQLQRIADLQAQLDVTLGEFRHLQGHDVRKKASVEPTQKRN